MPRHFQATTIDDQRRALGHALIDVGFHFLTNPTPQKSAAFHNPFRYSFRLRIPDVYARDRPYFRPAPPRRPTRGAARLALRQTLRRQNHLPARPRWNRDMPVRRRGQTGRHLRHRLARRPGIIAGADGPGPPRSTGTRRCRGPCIIPERAAGCDRLPHHAQGARRGLPHGAPSSLASLPTPGRDSPHTARTDPLRAGLL